MHMLNAEYIPSGVHVNKYTNEVNTALWHINISDCPLPPARLPRFACLLSPVVGMITQMGCDVTELLALFLHVRELSQLALVCRSLAETMSPLLSSARIYIQVLKYAWHATPRTPLSITINLMRAQHLTKETRQAYQLWHPIPSPNGGQACMRWSLSYEPLCSRGFVACSQAAFKSAYLTHGLRLKLLNVLTRFARHLLVGPGDAAHFNKLGEMILSYRAYLIPYHLLLRQLLRPCTSRAAKRAAVRVIRAIETQVVPMYPNTNQGKRLFVLSYDRVRKTAASSEDLSPESLLFRIHQNQRCT